MKNLKIILPVCLFLIFGVIACDKNGDIDNQANAIALSDSQDFDSPIVEEFDEEDAPDKEVFELQERASLPLPKITGVTGTAAGAAFGSACTAHPYAERLKVNGGTGSTSSITLTGENFGASKGTSTVTALYKIKGVEYPVPVTVGTWSPTSVALTLGELPDTFSVASIKLSASIAYKKNDSAAVELKLKSKSFKAVGNANSQVYGSEAYEIAKQRKAASKTPFIPTGTGTAIDTTGTGNYVPVVGDVLYRAGGDKGVVVAVGAPDSKTRIPVTVWQRNTTCKGSVKKGTWKTLKGGFIPKSTETAGTWTKFSH